MASATDSARPATEIRAKSFVSPSLVESNRTCLDWLKSSGLCRDQIVSITNHETEITEGDQCLLVFYREASIHANPVPCDAVQVAAFEAFKPWDEQLEDAIAVMRASAGADVLSLTRSPKQIGDARNQSVWYSKEAVAGGAVASAPVGFREFTRQDGDVRGVLEDARSWMVDYLAPHLLVSVTVHEDAHPNEADVVRVLVAHKAGANPPKLRDTAAAKTLPAGGLYTLTIRQGSQDDSWESVTQSALEEVNRIGGQEGHAITSTNLTADDGRLIAVYSWARLYEAQIEEELRPAGCCTIF